MPRVGFEPTIPVLLRAKTVDALDRAGNVIGVTEKYNYIKTHQFRRTNIIKALSRPLFQYSNPCVVQLVL
jgi:hypothetical protein